MSYFLKSCIKKSNRSIFLFEVIFGLYILVIELIFSDCGVDLSSIFLLKSFPFPLKISSIEDKILLRF